MSNPASPSRTAKLAAALKRNMARRKAAARPQTTGKTLEKQPPAAKDGRR